MYFTTFQNQYLSFNSVDGCIIYIEINNIHILIWIKRKPLYLISLWWPVAINCTQFLRCILGHCNIKTFLREADVKVLVNPVFHLHHLETNFYGMGSIGRIIYYFFYFCYWQMWWFSYSRIGYVSEYRKKNVY